MNYKEKLRYELETEFKLHCILIRELFYLKETSWRDVMLNSLRNISSVEDQYEYEFGKRLRSCLK